MELQLERFEAIGGSGVVEFDLRVRKFNHTTHAINGTFTILLDLDETYEISASFAYSTLGNNQFNEYPMKVPRKTMCDFMVDQYLRCQYLWRDSTNMPYLEEGTTEYCPFPAGAYWIKDMAPDASWWEQNTHSHRCGPTWTVISTDSGAKCRGGLEV
ncbi:uncharacterized protein LOC120412437 [Culex pipiens pallens]|uniref:uncharacterized protein LOC120412437 n=1 Tax=Culex pipiens pallens TaxID=42434 RepID=UPI0022AB21DF|nr:uncharacterized protein LOC120412437 [Culex pipiens pallens]